MERDQRNAYERMLGERLTRRSFLRATGMSGAALGLGAVLAACKSSSGGGGSTGASGGSGEAVKVGFVSPKTGLARAVRRGRRLRDRRDPGPAQRPYDRGQDPGHPDHPERQPVRSQSRGAGGVGPDHQRRHRPDVGGIDPGDDEPGLGTMRGQRRTVHLHGGAVAAVVPGPAEGSREPGAVQVRVPLLLGTRGHRAGLPGHVEHDQHEQESGGPVPERWRRQRVGRSDTSGSRASSDRTDTRSSIRAATRTARRTSARRSRRTRRRTRRSSPVCRSRPTSRTSGSRRTSKGSCRRSRRLGRRCCSRRPSRRSATSAKGCPRSTGGDRRTRSARRSPIRRRRSSRTRTRRPRAKQWTQPIGFVHALLEVAVDVLQRSSDLTPDAIVEAIAATNLNTIVGPIQWTGQPFPNVAKTQARRRAVEEGHGLSRSSSPS